MSLSIDSMRTEIAQRRNAVLGLQNREDRLRRELEDAEALVSKLRGGIATLQADISHENQVIDALQGAVAVLAERLPETPSRPSAVPDTPTRPRPDRIKGTHKEPARGGPKHYDGTTVRAKRGTPGKKSPKLQPKRTVQERADALNLSRVSPGQLERADLVHMLIEDIHGPADGAMISEKVQQFFECKKGTAQAIVTRILPILLKQGRIQTADTDSLTTTWTSAVLDRHAQV